MKKKTGSRGIARAAVVTLAAWSLTSASSWALSDTASVTVSADLPQRAEVDMIRDVNSVGRGSTQTVLFDKTDDKDQPDGDSNFMYAPYRSETGKNWHLAKITSNGTKMTLTSSVTGAVNGTTELKDILDVFCGGFFEADGNDKGGKSGDWELLNTFKRDLQEPFTGSTPFSYRLRLRGVPSGTYNGSITYTLVSE